MTDKHSPKERIFTDADTIEKIDEGLQEVRANNLMTIEEITEYVKKELGI